MKTAFYQVFQNYKKYFINFENQYFNDDYVEAMKYIRDEYFIAFTEDKREHYVDFIFKKRCTVQIEIKNLKVNCLNKSLNIGGLNSLEILSDTEQIKTYIEFLITNSVI